MMFNYHQEINNNKKISSNSNRNFKDKMKKTSLSQIKNNHKIMRPLTITIMNLRIKVNKDQIIKIINMTIIKIIRINNKSKSSQFMFKKIKCHKRKRQ